MKIAILCKSDDRGGAAVVSRRLTEALRSAGQQATLVVVEKLTGASFVEEFRPRILSKAVFLADRLLVYSENGFTKRHLFDIDTGLVGLPLSRLKTVKEADVVILNWVNQGMLSLGEIRKLCRQGKKVIWTMHDMWNFTGVCHHAHDCRNFTGECGCCPLLKKPSAGDMSNSVWHEKKNLYMKTDIRFVGVSSWVTARAHESSLLGGGKLTTIPNPFPIEQLMEMGLVSRDLEPGSNNGKMKIVFGAARIDAPIKGFHIFKKGLKKFVERYPVEASRVEVVLYGAIKDRSMLSDLPLSYEWLGEIRGIEKLAEIYRGSDVVVSTSDYENLPGTLIEGQAFGCIPVAFDRGGQKDIITHLETGYLMEWTPDVNQRASAIASAIHWALFETDIKKDRLVKNVVDKFSYRSVSEKYLDLIES